MPLSQQNIEACPCLEGDSFFQNFDQRDVGVDEDFGEVSIDRCRRCGRYWLQYHIEYEYLSRSGRWFRGLIAPEVAASVESARAKKILEGLGWYFRGGSAFGGKVTKTQGPLKYWLVPFSGPE
jgi:hypothetical protein